MKTLKQQAADSVLQNCEKLSPILPHMFYRALMTCLRIRNRPPLGVDIDSTIASLKMGLEMLQDRWLVSRMLSLSIHKRGC